MLKIGGTGTVQGKSVDITGSYAGISVQLGANSVYNQIATAQEDMKALLQELISLHPNTPIFVNSCMQVNPKSKEHGYAWDPAKMRDSINEFNTDISNYCNQINNLYYVDISEELNDLDGYVKSEYTGDGLHCNSAGAEVFASNVKNAILSSGATNSSSNANSDNSNASTYMLVVANKTNTKTSTIRSYDYTKTIVRSTGSGSTGLGTQTTETPQSEQIRFNNVSSYSSTMVDYQTALNNYTLYFDFLWAILVNTSGNVNFISSFADLATNSNVTITVYDDETVSQTTSSDIVGTYTKLTHKPEVSTVIEDVYEKADRTTITTTNITSKPTITYADTWLLKYENDANTYNEYQFKSKEVITEKVDPNSSENNIIKLLQSNRIILKALTREKYLVDRMIEDNEQVAFMSDIYEYILNIANGKDIDQNKLKLTNTLDTSLFDLTNSNTVTQKILSYTSLTISKEDKELLYKFVEQTGNNCSTEEKSYIASVILNRAISGKFGTSNVSRIINAKYQFENYDSSINDTITPSDETKSAVDDVIASGDKSEYSVYFATPETSSKKGWDNAEGSRGFNATVKGKVYNFYTTEDITKELKKLEQSIAAGVFSSSGPSEIAKEIVEWAESQVGKSSFYNKHQGIEQAAKNYCAPFVQSAYYEAGLEYYGGNAEDLPYPNKIELNTDGTVDWSNIPVGAIIVSKIVPGDDVEYTHVSLYIGDGYIIEAGGSTIQKTPIDESLAAQDNNTFLGWGFATHDQEDAQSKLISITGIGGNYQEGWTDLSATVGNWSYDGESSNGTGIQGVYKAGNKSYVVYSQGAGPWANMELLEPSRWFSKAGCGVTALSTILTGWGYNINPAMFQGMHSAGDEYLFNHMKTYGVKYKKISNLSEAIEELKKGNPVLCHTKGWTGGHYYEFGHYVTLLGINSQGQIFLGDPGCRTGRTGYFAASEFSGLDRFFVVYK